MGQEWGAHSPVGPASQGRRCMIRGGRGGCDTQLQLGSRLREQTVPASLLHGAAPPGTALGGVGAGGLTGHLLAQGFREFPEGPLKQLPVPLEGKGGPEVLRARDERLGCREAPPAQRGEPALPRACEAGGGGGAALSVPGPTAQ